jgi:5-(carboxyamino)imidazole ribonucleotide synthase
VKIGVIGGGQLGRMLALAGYPLGLRFVFLDPEADACAGQIGELVQARYDDHEALEHLASEVDCITFEFENVPGETVEQLAGRVPVFPPAKALATAQDRLIEKTLFGAHGVATPRFAPIASLDHLESALATIGLPAVLKTSRLGYDGKGQALLRRHEDARTAWEGLRGVPMILESFVEFDRELSIIAVRGRSGETVFYPLVENRHRGGVLRVSEVCAERALQKSAEEIATRLLETLDYVGVLALELFQVGDRLLANEMAPRVHNSGHWTIEGAETSQFENHLRAIIGLPLGSTCALGCTGMVNFLGHLPDPSDILQIPRAHLHSYGKEPRPGRKVGHATVRACDASELRRALEKLTALAETTPKEQPERSR